jgi:DNA-binding NarL/FixJ family response regulator
MSFDGDLDHLPIVDVIQLLHATRKSGTLTLRSLKGEGQLVFHDGFIVSANHVNNSVRIGQILVEMGAIAPEELDKALQEQQQTPGTQRKPLIQTLVESGRVQTETAYQGLETLIEMTIVEVLTWTKGTFSLDVNRIYVSDEYRYFPEQLKQEIQLNTQNVLMDALRIYDERKRDGTLSPEALFGTPREGAAPVEEFSSDDDLLSDADLGLDMLDDLERKVPEFFSPLMEIEPDSTLGRLQPLLGGVPAEEQQRLATFLDQFADDGERGASGTGVILVTRDKLVRECVSAVCGSRFLLATDDAAGVDAIVDHSLSTGRTLFLILDAGEPGSRTEQEAALPLLQQKREKYPELAVLLLTCPGDYQLNMRALQAGATAVLPRSSREERQESFISDTIECTRALHSYLSKPAAETGHGLMPRFKEMFLAVSRVQEPPEVTFQLLQAVSSLFDRALTMVLLRSELIAERGIGITASGATSSVKLRIPVPDSDLFRQVLAGQSYYGDADQALRSVLFHTIGEPASQKILLLPVQSFGRVIAMIYADFGSRAGGAPQLELLETLALQAGLVIDNALYRKRSAQMQ